MELNIEIAETASQAIATELLKLLADEYVLYTKTRNAYWNMEDSHLSEREKLFDDQANQLTEIIDSIAKTIRSMEHYAFASLKSFSKITHLTEVWPDQNESLAYIRQLIYDHDSVVIHCKEYAHYFATESMNTAATDFIADLQEKHESMAWMLRSHLK